MTKAMQTKKIIPIWNYAEALFSETLLQGLISLCSGVARARDPKDESLRPQDPSNPRIQQLHYARLECYQVVLGILDDVLSFARQRGRLQSSLPVNGPQVELPELLPARLSEFDAIPILDGLLRYCLEGEGWICSNQILISTSSLGSC